MKTNGRQRTTGYNSTLAIGGVSSPLDSFVVTESSVLRINFCAKNPATSQICKTLSVSVKSQTHKQHWFLPTQKPTLKKPKELFFANARTEIEIELNK